LKKTLTVYPTYILLYSCIWLNIALQLIYGYIGTDDDNDDEIVRSVGFEPG